DARPGGYRDGASGSLGLDVDRELTYRWHHIHDVARLQHVVGMVGEDTAREPLDPDPELPGACGSTDRVRATHVLAVDEEAHRDVLAGDVSEAIGQLMRDVERHCDRVVGEPAHLGDTQGVEGEVAHSSLNQSKGSPHDEQTMRALQAVEPKRATRCGRSARDRRHGTW